MMGSSHARWLYRALVRLGKLWHAGIKLPTLAFWFDLPWELERMCRGSFRAGASRGHDAAWCMLAGCEALFVHILWVNTRARQFYESQGFYIDMEESANTAHYRGHCLEGIEGRGRTILLRFDLVERSQKPAQHRII